MNSRMHPRSALFGLLTLATLTAAGMAGAAPRDRGCATVAPTAQERQAIASALRAYAQRHGIHARSATIQVALHIITDRGLGDLTQTQIDAQMAELNKSYAGGYGGVNTGYRFVLASVDRTEDHRWFKLGFNSGEERQMKKALAIDPAHRLNVYTASLTQGLLGWAYFPMSFPEDYFLHGVVIHYGSVPGGNQTPYDLGGTLDHEVGHYLGLFHTFQGGCTEPGDEIADTPAEATPTSGCPEDKDTCPAPGLDPIHNYMDYSYDACYTEFTSGQKARIDAIVPVYRPSLLDASAALAQSESRADAALAPAALAFAGASPNPFRVATELSFALPRAGVVNLSVYNVAGQRVATLVDGPMAAGPQRVSFRAGSLAPGMYFTALRVGGTTLTRSVILVN